MRLNISRNSASAVLSLSFISFSYALGTRALQSGSLAPALDLPGNWTYSGCYTEIDGGRTLSQDSYGDVQNMTAATCISYCSGKGYLYAGTEYSSQCWCGISISPASTQLNVSDCSMPCAGDPTQQCGDSNRLSIYWSGLTGPQTNPGISPWSFVSCFTEGTGGQRTLPSSPDIAGQLTIDLCTSACQAAGYTLAGAEYASQCFCGNVTSNGGSPAANPLDCNMPCAGNASEWCGGPNRLDLYQFNNTYNQLQPSSTAPSGPAPTGPSNKPTVGNYSYFGCQTEGNGTRALTPGVQTSDEMTVELCQTYCAGYILFGVEYGRECYCGNSFNTGSTVALESDCSATCYGNPYEYCGGGDRLSVYVLNA